MHAPVVRAAKSRVRTRRHPRVLVGEVPELAPLPPIQRLTERQAVDDMGDVRALRVLGLLRPVWKSTSELGYRSRGRHRVDGVEYTVCDWCAVM